LIDSFTISLFDRPVLFASFSSSDEVFSGKLTERTERITHLLYYNTLHPKSLSRSGEMSFHNETLPLRARQRTPPVARGAGPLDLKIKSEMTAWLWTLLARPSFSIGGSFQRF
jgi:hypothetical protein